VSEETDFSGITEMLQGVLNSDEGKQQIQNVLSMLNGDAGKASTPGMATGGIDPDNVEMIMKLQQIMSMMNNSQNSKQAALLQSLKVFLRPERRDKVDTAVKFLNIGRAIEAFKKIEGV